MNAPSKRVLGLGRASFDAVSGHFEVDGRVTTLRPRTAAFLAFLVEHAGRVVTKDELMAAVWSDAVVTEDSLVQCVKEIRQALGTAGRDWVRTVPRQGYAFVGPTQEPAPAPAPAPERVRQRWPGAAFGRPLALAMVFAVAAGAIGAVLWRPAVPTGATAPSIVVLPIANQTGDPSRELVAEDLTETLAAALGRVPGLMVIAPATAFTFKGKPVDARRMADELGVRYVLDGSLRTQDGRPSLRLRLNDATSAALVWSEDFAGQGTALHAEVSARVARSFSLRLARAEAQRAKRERPHDPTAADQLAQARALLRWAAHDSDAHRRARELLEDVVQRDPSLAEAWALLARTYVRSVRFRSTYAQDLERASQTVDRALALDPDGADALETKGWVLYNQKRVPQALETFEHGLELSPNDPTFLAGRGASLIVLGRPEEALAPLEMAIRLSPRDPLVAAWQMFHGVADFQLGRDDRAIEWLERSIQENPNGAFAHLFLAAALGTVGRTNEARARMAEFQRLRPGFTLTQFRDREPSNVPAVRAQRERIYEGLRRAGMPE